MGRMRTAALTAVILLFVNGCGSRHPHGLSDDATVLAGDKAASLLHQCSRDAPPMGDATWQPTVDDITAVERVLPKFLVARSAPGDPDFSEVLVGWRRQYVGIIRNGRRFIYGNFFPKEDRLSGPWLYEPEIVCDGGASYFGIEYDVYARKIANIAFNGVA